MKIIQKYTGLPINGLWATSRQLKNNKVTLTPYGFINKGKRLKGTERSAALLIANTNFNEEPVTLDFSSLTASQIRNLFRQAVRVGEIDIFTKYISTDNEKQVIFQERTPLPILHSALDSFTSSWPVTISSMLTSSLIPTFMLFCAYKAGVIEDISRKNLIATIGLGLVMTGASYTILGIRKAQDSKAEIIINAVRLITSSLALLQHSESFIQELAQAGIESTCTIKDTIPEISNNLKSLLAGKIDLPGNLKAIIRKSLKIIKDLPKALTLSSSKIEKKTKAVKKLEQEIKGAASLFTVQSLTSQLLKLLKRLESSLREADHSKLTKVKDLDKKQDFLIEIGNYFKEDLRALNAAIRRLTK